MVLSNELTMMGNYAIVAYRKIPSRNYLDTKSQM